MRAYLLFVACVAGIGLSGTSAFEARTAASAQLSEQEVQRYDRIKKTPGVRNPKLTAVDEKMLSRDTLLIDIDGKRVGFKVVKNEGEAVWKGRSGKNFDRFVVRNIDGRYSGHMLYRGRQFVLTPIKRGISLWHEVSGSLECGMVGETLGGRR